MLVHLTTRSVTGRPLVEWFVAASLWQSLRRAFPQALAAVLMPNHPHLILDTADPAQSRATLALVLAALERRAPSPEWRRGRPRWEPVPPPERIADVKHLRRLIRYVALNPCRAEIVRDPLEWEWSTHRDIVGAISDPWIAATRLAAVLGAGSSEPAVFATRWHAYVSGDPDCDVKGTSPPRPARPTDLPVSPLGRIAAAAAAATRSQPSAIRERTSTRLLFVHLAWRQGWRQPALLARACGVTPEAVRQLRARPIGHLLLAGELCLGDERLLRCRLGGR